MQYAHKLQYAWLQAVRVISRDSTWLELIQVRYQLLNLSTEYKRFPTACYHWSGTSVSWVLTWKEYYIVKWLYILLPYSHFSSPVTPNKTLVSLAASMWLHLIWIFNQNLPSCSIKLLLTNDFCAYAFHCFSIPSSFCMTWFRSDTNEATCLQSTSVTPEHATTGLGLRSAEYWRRKTLHQTDGQQIC